MTDSLYIDGKKIEGAQFKGLSTSWATASAENVKADLFNMADKFKQINSTSTTVNSQLKLLYKYIPNSNWTAPVSMSVPLEHISDETYKMLFGVNKEKHIPGENCLF